MRGKRNGNERRLGGGNEVHIGQGKWLSLGLWRRDLLCKINRFVIVESVIQSKE